MEKLRFDYSSSFDSYTIFWFNLVCLIFFFFQVNHKIKNRSTQSTLFQKQFFSLAHPNFILRDGIFLWNTFFFFSSSSFAVSSKILPSLSRNVGNTYTHGAQTHASVKGFSLSLPIFLSRHFRQFYLYPLVSRFRIISKMNNFPAKKLLCIVFLLLLKILAYIFFHRARWLNSYVLMEG